MTRLTRRRAIGIIATAGLECLPRVHAANASLTPVTWRGQALGAIASLQIYHPDLSLASRLIERSVAEARRLERIFSLYRSDSALVELNRSGVLVSPPEGLVTLLATCRQLWELSSGAFDPTIQPVWALYYRHFSSAGADAAGPPPADVKAALALVDFGQVRFDTNRIALGRRGMALTLNGIAQGYITDRIVDLLRAEGIAHSIVDMGEPRAIGGHPDGRPWRVGIADPTAPERIGENLDVLDKAVATSGGYGFRFDAAGRLNHLLHAKTGKSPQHYRSMTVVARTATLADGLSTALCFVGPQELDRGLQALENIEVHLTPAAGRRLRLGSRRT